MAKKKIFLVVAVFVVLTSIFVVSCNKEEPPSLDEGKTVVLPTLTKVKIIPGINGHNGDEQSDVCLEVYNNQTEHFFIEIHLSNPDSLEIISLNYNGEKYEKSKFSAGSNNKVITIGEIKLSEQSGTHEVKIDEIRYLTQTGKTEKILGLKDNVKTIQIQPTFNLTMDFSTARQVILSRTKVVENGYMQSLALVPDTNMNDYVTLDIINNPVYGEQGYVFVGWFTEKDGKGTQVKYGDIYTFYKDITVYPYYARPYTYRVENEEVIITGVSEEGKKTTFPIEIPSELEGYPVRKIASYAFTSVASNKIIILPDTIVEIGDYAFMNSMGMQIELGSVEKIGKMAFANCGKIILGGESSYYRYRVGGLPNTLREIGAYAFKGCTWDTSIPNPYRGDMYFQMDDALLIPQTVTSIGEGCFQNSLFKAVYFEKNINLTTKNFGKSAFESAKELKGLYLGFAFNETGSTFTTSATTGVKDIPDKCFYNCINLYSTMASPEVKLSEGLETIGELSFASSGEGMQTLSYLSYPNSLKKIGKQAFANTNLTTVRFKEDSTLSEIGEYAFENSKFEEITIYSLTYYGKAPFWGNTNLKAINILTDNVPYYVETDAVWGAGLTRKAKYYVKLDALTSFRDKNGSWAKDGASDYVCAYDLITTAQNGVKLSFEPIDDEGNLSLGSNKAKITSVFNADREITIPSVIVHNNLSYEVYSVGTYFIHDKITKVYLPTTLKRIEDRAFYTCDVLYEVVWKEGNTTYQKDKNENVALEYVGADAFNGSAITYFYSNRALKEIGKQAFHNCKNLSTVVLDRGTSLVIKGSAFSQGGIKTLVIGLNVSAIYDSAFQGNKELSIVLINLVSPPNSTENNYPSISPFRECSGLSKVYLFSNNAMQNFKESTIGGKNNVYSNLKKSDNITSAYEKYNGTWSEALDYYIN